jgi:uncharacterized membrane protein (DUF106 family)
MADVVKIDQKLLEKIKKIIDKDRIRYSNAKQFVNIAVLEKLNNEESKGK